MYSSPNSGREHSNEAADETEREKSRDGHGVAERRGKNEVLNGKTTCSLTHRWLENIETSKRSIECTPNAVYGFRLWKKIGG